MLTSPEAVAEMREQVTREIQRRALLSGVEHGIRVMKMANELVIEERRQLEAFGGYICDEIERFTGGRPHWPPCEDPEGSVGWLRIKAGIGDDGVLVEWTADGYVCGIRTWDLRPRMLSR